MNPSQYNGTAINTSSLLNPADVAQGLKNKTRSGVAWLSGEKDNTKTGSGNSNSNNKQSNDGFASFGLEPQMLDTLTRVLHFNQPTPIQRKAIPLLMQGNDVVGMARTGSGKTAAFCIPMIHRLKEHSTMIGMRGVVFSPTRELALQTLRHFRLLAKHTNLKSTAITGGDGLNAQFEAVAENPDVVIASPGRLLHITEEVSMNLLARVQVVVLDEADRLFEMGFQAQVVALIKKVPERAQRCLFSATMPTILAEFTEAGLHNPVVVRLDAETKISTSLKHSAFVVRGDEKYGALLYLLTKWAKVPCQVITTNMATADPIRKRIHPAAIVRNKRNKEEEEHSDDEYVGGYADGSASRVKQVLVFVESKYHVEFLGELLPNSYGIKTVAIHGALDQEARREAISIFRKRLANVMVVTDVAARGIDLPALDYIINFSFPHEPKLFVHRVGRVARAGRQGTAYSIVTQEDMPYYFDCMQFIGKNVLCRRPKTDAGALAASGFTADDGCYGRIPTHQLQAEVDTLNKLVKNSLDLKNLFGVTTRAHDKYTRTKKRATHEAMSASHDNQDLRYENIPIHPMIDETLDEKTRSYHCAVTDLRRFKAKETLIDMVNGGPIFHLDPVKYANKNPRNNSEVIGKTQTQIDEEEYDPLDNPKDENDTSDKNESNMQRFVNFGANNNKHNMNSNASAATLATGGAATLRRLTAEILGGEQAKQHKELEARKHSKPSLAERMAQRAFERKNGLAVSNAGAGNSGLRRERDQSSALDIAVRPMFGDDTNNNDSDADGNDGDDNENNNNDDPSNLYKKKTNLSGKFRDNEYFLPLEKQETVDSQYLSVKGHAMDINAESAEDQSRLRGVFAWNKQKNRYIKMNVNDAKAMVKGMKNESGKKIDFKTKLDAYRIWMKSSNMRIQDVGEQEDFTKLRLHQQAKDLGERGEGDDNDDGIVVQDEMDQSLVDDPKHKQKARLGRKMKKLPKEGKVKTFEQMSLEKRRKAKDADKLEKRRARKSSKKGANIAAAAGKRKGKK